MLDTDRYPHISNMVVHYVRDPDHLSAFIIANNPTLTGFHGPADSPSWLCFVARPMLALPERTEEGRPQCYRCQGLMPSYMRGGLCRSCWQETLLTSPHN